MSRLLVAGSCCSRPPFSAHPLLSSACLRVISPPLQEFLAGIISDIQSSVGRNSISPATRLRDGDHSSYWQINNHVVWSAFHIILNCFIYWSRCSAAWRVSRASQFWHHTLFGRRCLLTWAPSRDFALYNLKTVPCALPGAFNQRILHSTSYSSQYRC